MIGLYEKLLFYQLIATACLAAMSSIKLRSQPLADSTEIRVLISHPMENGRNRDAVSGELIPAHFIEQLTIQLNEVTVIDVDMAGSIAKNPFFSFRLKGVVKGDKIRAVWIDNQQLSDSAELVINE